ncbi:MAG: NAD(+) diphosphatase [Brevundimonas sp.]|uniref:NAD(+) diphosphatase n=1 Tax=Brevundimonas sp. TaxID=1871086 RepID=UPI002715B012|nr:NAD(+) diphosphatase [Brevundimonas sp.]MDO9587070.1 NAD(+) diphosphatase [Brevundimonas sp.]MDP3369208.1 NAD(+) diphosphatase [Brevundimonas sp.]MDP3656425.1 NAD(+) diphosphatase [Brevundimonas sp.]MDZ4109028.1 NAD(+) diphosphatase [Brevundimonas sp.]
MPLPALNTFAGDPLDRAGDLRNDPERLAEQVAHPEAVAMVLWEGRPLVEDAGEPRLVWLALDHARAVVPDRELFLGLWNGAPCFAVEVEGSVDPAAGPLAGLGAFPEMREAAAMLPGPDAAMAGTAKSLFDWRRRHGFCAACGVETETAGGGWKRACPACRVEHFPRVDPVTIMLAVYKGGPEPRCLLGRQAAWPEGRMSALAGFLEPGETIEAACAREIEEEAGLTVTAVRYHSSQPWPFPSQLMIGLICEVDSDDARPDQTELQAVAWLTRDEAADVLEGTHPSIKAPPRIAIARTLLQAWVDGFEV